MTGIILAGGRSRRIGRNKAFLEINGTKIIDRIVNIFKTTFHEVILVTNSPLEYLHLDLRIVTDLVPQKGALGGLYTGLFYASSHHIFVSACDMPFLNREFIDYVISKTGDFDVVVHCSEDGFQPLHAVYSKRCMRHMEALMKSERLKITEIYRKVKVREINARDIRPFDPEGTLFFNVNTPEDLERAVNSVVPIGERLSEE